MSDESSAAISAVRRDWVSDHREMYLQSGGTKGHVMDITAVGAYNLGTHMLLKYIGRKSGKIFVTPLCYSISAGEVLICASKGGADSHPEWYNNIRAMETVDIQIATEAWRTTWREPEGAEREKLWRIMADNFPFYDQYQASTERVIPLLLFKLGDSIPVFKESDATGMRPIG